MYKAGHSYFVQHAEGGKVKAPWYFAVVSGKFKRSPTARAGNVAGREHACGYLVTADKFGNFGVTSTKAGASYRVKSKRSDPACARHPRFKKIVICPTEAEYDRPEGAVKDALRIRYALALLAGLLLVSAGLLTTARRGASKANMSGRSPTTLTQLPVGLQTLASGRLGSAELRFGAHREDGVLVARGGGLTSRFRANGVSVRVGGKPLSLSLSGVGRGASLLAPQPALPSARSSTVSYARGPVTEWYRNGPLGLEQGFTVARRPRGSGWLTIAVRAFGPLLPRLGDSGVMFGDHRSVVYGGLQALDAGGKALPARLELSKRRLLLRVNDRAARYPLTVDPLVQQGNKLRPSDRAGNGRFGESVAISADGNTALIGGSFDNGAVGAAWVFVRSGGTWRQQGGKLIASDESGAGRFGGSVALSDDGNTALIGGSDDNSGVGAAWLFRRSGTTWSQLSSKLVAVSGEVGDGDFGQAVALSGDGSTALIGGPGNNSFVGTAWVFAPNQHVLGHPWTQQAVLSASGETGSGRFGGSVALSDDGNTALVGAPFDNSATGGVWAFARSGTTWNPQGGEQTPNDESGSGGFGGSLALSDDGNTALVGGSFENSNTGAAWAFVRSGSTWSQQGSKLTPSDETGNGDFGGSVALSGDGNTALIGGPYDNTFVGAAWKFVRSAGAWSQRGSKLTGSGESGAGRFGSVALSSDGNTAFIGAAFDNNDAGAAWAFSTVPVITVITPASGPPAGGRHVTITGANFTGALAVHFGAAKASFAVVSDSRISAVSPPGTGRVEVTVTGPQGTSATSADDRFTYRLPRPSASHLTQTNKRWRLGKKLAVLTAAGHKKKPPVGTTFRFTLNTAATVKLDFRHTVQGRRVKGRCVARSKRNRHKKACKRTVSAGTLSFTAHTGTTKVAFQGRLSSRKKLSPGRYTLVLTATNTAGRSNPIKITFTIVKG